jgi:hypothetical protein
VIERLEVFLVGVATPGEKQQRPSIRRISWPPRAVQRLSTAAAGIARRAATARDSITARTGFSALCIG